MGTDRIDGQYARGVYASYVRQLGEVRDGGAGMTREPYGSSAMDKMMDRVRDAPESIDWVFEFSERVP